ncbi:MAG: GH3 auxin-responsive promoter family protein [Salinivirgaceae bacterium]|nr:GH3 auxin-responsive promoter family protein [Salinivirgaceae bacterium]
MPILKGIVNWITIKRMNEIDLFRKYPGNMQRDQLLNLIELAEDTEWGKKYNFDSIKSYYDFKKQVPLQEYDDIKPYVDRLRVGEKNLLWPGEIRWFAKSSGTTNDKSKFIPVSQEAIDENHFRGGKDVMYFNQYTYPENRVLKGKGLIIGGSHKINNFSNESYFGDLSAILIENMPFYAEFYRTPKSEIALLDNWEEKLEQMANATITENVTNISGVPSWTLVLIKRILDITGKNNLLEVWPNLELFIHGGVSFTPYLSQFKHFIPKDSMHYLETYNASEGFFGIQDDPNDKSMLLMLDYGVFYEFIPMSEYDKPNASTLCVDEVKTDVNYAIVISTNSGLWRYIIGDTVKFTQTYPHKFIITGRTRHFINAFGEELIVDNAEKALNTACLKSGAEINEYTAAPIYMNLGKQGAHEWLIEFEKEPKNLEYFTYILDEALKSANSDYEAKRFNNYTLDMPIVHSINKGTFHRWLESKGKLGGQHKIPRLSNNRQYVDEILKM